MPVSTNSRLVDLCTKLGYVKDSPGLCAGASMTWLEAIIFGNEAAFNERMRRIIKDEDLLDKIQQTKNSLRDRKEPTFDEYELINILALFERITVYAEHPSELFGRFVSQNDIESLSQIAAPATLDASEGLRTIYSECSINTGEDIQVYLDGISSAIKKSDCPPCNIGFLLAGIGHRMALSYNTSSNLWRIMDINQWEPSASDTIEELGSVEIAPQIFKGLFTNIGCGLVKMSSQPNSEQMSSFVRSQYVLVEEALYYFDKIHNKLERITENPDEVEAVNQILISHGSMNHRVDVLSRSLLADITSITSHVHNIVCPYVVFQTTAIIPRNSEYHFRLKESLDELKKSRPLSEEIAARRERVNLLWKAAEVGDVETVTHLYQLGANLNYAYQKRKPLMISVQNGHLDVVSKLIEFGVDINQAASDGCTPLFMAAQNGHLSIVSKLIECGADVDVIHNNVTPLFIASNHGHFDVVEKLVQAGAHINSTNTENITPMWVAAYTGNLESVNRLAELGADVNIANINGATPLYVAVQNGYLSVASKLIDLGADINAASKDGITALYVAAHQGNFNITRELIEREADVHVADNDGITPLFLAAKNGHSEVVKLILKKDLTTQLVPFISNVNKLRNIVSEYDDEVLHKMNEFIISKLNIGETEESISILPLEIAAITGDERTIHVFKEFHNREVCNNAKEAMRHLREDKSELNEPKSSSAPSLSHGSSEDA